MGKNTFKYMHHSQTHKIYTSHHFLKPRCTLFTGVYSRILPYGHSFNTATLFSCYWYFIEAQTKDQSFIFLFKKPL